MADEENKNEEENKQEEENKRQVKKLIICANSDVPDIKTKEMDDAAAASDENGGVNTKTAADYFFTRANFAGKSGDEVKLLKLGDCWTSESVEDDAVWSWAMKSGNDVTRYTVTLTGIKFDKKVFSPGGLELTFNASCQVDGSSAPIPLSKFINRNFIDNVACYVDAFGVKEGVEPSEVTDKTQVVYFSQNYYVHEVFVKSKSSKSQIFTLKCYSFDNILRMTSYCEAYSGKRFVKDIVKGKVDSLLEDIEENLKSFSEENEIPLYDFAQEQKQDSTQGQTPESNPNTNRLMMMGYSDSDSSDLRHRAEHDPKDTEGKNDKYNNVELIHPYLVQYNESFYDFMSRVAHRCGEFLYFEKGRINLGLPYDTWALLSLSELPSDENIPFTSPFCSYQSISSITGKTVAGFHKDYVNGMDGGDSEASYRYDIQNAADEDLHTVIDDDNVIEPAGAWFLWTALGTFFTSEELLDGIVEAVEEIVKYGCMTGITEAFVESDYKKHTEESAQISSNVGIAATEIVTKDTGIDDIENLCNSFFHTVEGLETKAEHGKVLMDFSSNLPDLYLGSPVNLQDGLSDYYIVTRMTGEYVSTDSSETAISISAEGVPVMEGCFKDVNYIALPERGDIPHSRKVSPMEAVVMDNVDPLRLGRVRVQYPWASEDGGWSPWIRITVPFTGNPGTGGFTMTPETGEHVMLNYVNGNIERPFVEGSLYYREYEDGEWTVNKPEIGGIEETDIRFFKTSYKVRSILSAKGHGLMIEDGTDKDILSAVLPGAGTILNIIGAIMGEQKFNFSNLDSEGEATINGGQITLMDGSGFCEIDIIPTQRQINISSCWGAVSIDAFTGITLNAPNGNINIRGKNVSIEAGNNLSLKAGSNISDEGRITTKGVAEAVSRAVGDLVMELGNAALVEATGVDLKGACDLSFLRAIYEIIIRPVEGTMRIGSKRNVVMTAGKGKVDIPKSLLSDAKETKKGESYRNLVTDSVESYTQPLRAEISKCEGTVVAFCGDFKKEYSLFYDLLSILYTDVGTANRAKDDFRSKYSTLEKTFETVTGSDKIEAIEKVYDDSTYNLNKYEYEKLKHEYESVRDAYDVIKTQFTMEKLKGKLDSVDYTYSLTGGECISALGFPSLMSTGTGYNGCNEEDLKKKTKAQIEESVDTFSKVAVRSLIIQQILKKVKEADSKLKLCKTEGGKIKSDEYETTPAVNSFKDAIEKGGVDWDLFVRRLKWDAGDDDDDGVGMKIGQGLASGLSSFIGLGEYDDGDFKFGSFEMLRNKDGQAGPRAWSEASAKGKILLSDDAAFYSALNDEMSGWKAGVNNNLRALSDVLNNKK